MVKNRLSSLLVEAVLCTYLSFVYYPVYFAFVINSFKTYPEMMESFIRCRTA